MVSVIIPTLFPTPFVSGYVSKLVGYKSVKEVIVVVNGEDETPSPPPRVAGELPQGSKSFLREGVVWNFLGKNLGFTGACNAGAKVVVGDLILFLNDDCEMTEEAFLALVDFMEKNVDIVATQPIVMKRMAHGEWRNENIGFWIDTRIGKAQPVTVNSSSKQEHQDIKEGSLHPRNAGSRDDKNPESLNAYPSVDCRLTTNDYIYGLSGTCLLIRKDIFVKVGMWDESFHSYLEDVDLAIRLYKAGYKVAPCLDAEVTHEHMATSSKMGLYKEKKDVMNWWRLILKHPDVFVRPAQIFPLLLERGRNLSGLLKKILHS